MIPSLQSRCGRHSCAMQQRVVPRGLIRGSVGLNPPAHPIILTEAKQAAEPPPRRAAEAQHSQGRPVPVGRYSRQRGLQRRRQAGMPSSTRVRTPRNATLSTVRELGPRPLSVFYFYATLALHRSVGPFLQDSEALIGACQAPEIGN
jgi:hypothetical protein